MCIRDSSMVTEKNNMHDVDTSMFFKWVFKAFVAVYLVTHTFDITMAVFDICLLYTSYPKSYEAVPNTDFKKSGYGTPEN